MVNVLWSVKIKVKLTGLDFRYMVKSHNELAAIRRFNRYMEFNYPDTEYTVIEIFRFEDKDVVKL